MLQSHSLDMVNRGDRSGARALGGPKGHWCNWSVLGTVGPRCDGSVSEMTYSSFQPWTLHPHRVGPAPKECLLCIHTHTTVKVWYFILFFSIQGLRVLNGQLHSASLHSSCRFNGKRIPLYCLP
ncbi:hypothetical protein KIL84_020199 [Mauremys mutica]|uniref:Uncharacterized protein n=1 Tax=Mauremys mutica TaxID=74926 RepID=A0A9D3XYD6_9SAUR|nr:hypothetical protein KIL84_020199 [Mauremys mutica]